MVAVSCCTNQYVLVRSPASHRTIQLFLLSMATTRSSSKQLTERSPPPTCVLCQLEVGPVSSLRSLHCGHSFCSECLQARLQQRGRNWFIECPLDCGDVFIRRGEISSLGLHRNHGFKMRNVLRIHLKFLNGDMLPLLVNSNEHVLNVKERIVARRIDCKLHLLRLAIMLPGDDGTHQVLRNSCSIGFYSEISNLSTVAVMIAGDTASGNLLRTLDPVIGNSSEYIGLNEICVSADGSTVFISDYQHSTAQSCVHALRATDGACLHKFELFGAAHEPRGICLSVDESYLFVADFGSHCVHVFRSSDGVRLHAIGSQGSALGQFRCPHAVCVSTDNRLLFVSDLRNHRVQSFRMSDFSVERAFGCLGGGREQLRYPRGMSVTARGALLVADLSNHRVQIFRCSDGVHLRSIGSFGIDTNEFCHPSSVCTTPDGELLAVSDTDNERVQLLHFNSGEVVHSIHFADTSSFEPFGMCISALGELFVVDRHSRRVFVFSIDAYKAPL